MSILGTGVSGLLAFQRALATTSHNIANAATEGYSRQRVDLSARAPQYLGGSYLGTGVQVSSVRRMQDDLVSAQLRGSLTNNANSEVRAAFAERVDRLLADESTGLTPSLQNYFAAVQDVADDPTAIPGRTVFLKEAETLAARFGAVNGQLEEQRSLVNGQIKATVEEINQYAQSLADLNRKIVSGSTSGSPANDLLDQRDNLLNKLAEKIDLSTSKQDDGAINVFIGNGQALVMGGGTRQLTTGYLSGDPSNLDIGFTSSSGQPVDVTRFMSGGEIGGLLETRASVLDTAQNELGLIGLTLATSFNEQNRLGLDLNGELGGDLFELPAVDVYARSGNTATASPGVTIDNVSQLTPSDYRLSYSSAGFQLTRQPDNQSVTLVPDATDPNILVGDGLRIDTNSLSTAASGDSWLIQPTRSVANDIKVAITDPAGIAAASGALAEAANTGDARPTGLRVTADPPTPDTYLPAAVVVNDAGDEFNLLSPRHGADAGSATVEAFRVLDPKNSNLLVPASVTFDATKNQFDVDGERFSLDPSGTTTITANGWELKVKGAPDDGAAFEIDVASFPLETPQPATTTIDSVNGWELDIRGTPGPYDTFTVDLGKGREGDNRNMLAMTDLQDARIVEGHTTFQGGYNSILSDVGTETRQVQIARDSSAVLLADAQAQRESISGVNLDEEAANLIRFQQAYQAAAQVIAVSSTLFDTLLSAVRR
ncbi:flagellar hook-associated protein FlgK [uncultured Thiocystis sp.]|jgi:flagellar hook-associated protein 1 FlgK|uniref:flagellar hook-associated protein FlgK n=1 Tax=uncultured Thiocystis sp. TaxID=1202134 RepID=UPI0025F7CCB2|nr:flagellar hook-associated protein FlgK [uncultured Thiocystis sp.]